MDFDALEFDETSALESTHEKYRLRFSFDIGQEKSITRSQEKVFRFRWNSAMFHLVSGSVLSPFILPVNNEEGSC